MKAARLLNIVLWSSISLMTTLHFACSQLGVELIVNGGADSGAIADSQQGNEPDAPVPTGWAWIEGRFIAVTPTNGWWAGSNLGPGVTGNYFVGGRALVYSVLRQTVDLSGATSMIDAGAVLANLKARFGTWRRDSDTAQVVVRFYNAGGTELGRLSTIETSNAGYNDLGRDGGSFGAGIDYDVNLTWVPTATMQVPASTRYAEVDLIARRYSGTDMDGYIDDVSLILSPVGDLDRNGCVNDADLLMVLFNFGLGC